MLPAARVGGGRARLEISTDISTHRGRDLQSSVHQALQRGDKHLVVDCVALDDLDLRVLSSLIRCASACREQGASFEVANMRSHIKDEVYALHLGDRLAMIAD